jgi:signal transduction histidine kinase
MHYQDSRIFPTCKGKTVQSPLIRRFNLVKIVGIWLHYITRHLSIRQKIGYGYILSISIAILGTSLGLIVGEYYSDKAMKQFSIAEERYEQLNDLEKAVLEVKINHKQLIIGVEKNMLQHQDIKRLEASMKNADDKLHKLQSNLSYFWNKSDKYKYPVKLKGFIKTCDQEINSYNSLLYSLLKFANSPNPTPQDIQEKNKILQEISDVKQAQKVEQLSQTLKELVHSTIQQKKQARHTFRKAKISSLLIIVASMILSMVIAITLAWHTSRAIARPIKAVTRVAEKATQDGNFNLQAPVISNDEIGVLATSLNQLIQKVATQIRELQQTQAQLIQAEKMSSLGQMVAGIAHEINNPVNFIYANIDYATNYTKDLLELVYLYQQHYPQPNPEILEKIEETELEFIHEDLPKIMLSMHTGTERIRQIILSLRNFCHLDESEIKEVDIHQGIDNTLLILNHRINRGIDIIKNYNELPTLECYPAQLNQVFWHIISNAIDQLLIDKHLSNPTIFIQTKLIDAQQIEVRIRDNGKGIHPEIKDKIFDPFFTTKPVGEGTGMGLAICYQIVEKHRGTIQVISGLGQGAEFVVTLPRSQPSL